MKKVFLSLLLVAMGLSALAQQSIQLRSADKAECVKSDITSLRASFSFSTITAEDYNSVRGTFSWLSMANTVIGGNEGDPQIPVINELIAVPFGANPYVEIKSYSTTDYRLEDLGIHTLVPRQPSLRKDQRPEDVPFIMNEDAYRTRGFRSEPRATVNVEGIMRGVQLGKMTIEPVSYDPVNNTLRVFNDIEVEVHFDGADAQATEKMMLDTYSPYFDVVYNSLFNGRGLRSVYDQHPDLYRTPVKMLVVTTSTFANSTAFQNWLTWKKQKGIEVDIYTVTSSTSSSTIRSGIQSRYNTNHPSFLVIVGDETVVPHYSLWDYGSTYGNAATDLEYASVDGDIYHDMFLSRMPVATTSQLGYLVDKTLMYEKYTMPDPSYLNETLLIAGWDEYWTAVVGKPTINYAANNYFNTAHGITPHTFITTEEGQTTCYNFINNVGFVNYTAHGDIQKWHDPEFTNSQVNSLTNANKPFWAMGNCCLTANFKNAQNSQTCFGETMVRAQNKAAFGYIGSVVESYWYEDYYFGVGAFNAGTSGSTPSVSGTQKGAYDAMFDDTGFNTLNSVPYIGNVSVSYAYANNYTHSTGTNSYASEEYYWRCYFCFGDGSVMPYLKVPTTNNVSHASALQIGDNSFTVNADARSYVSITVNNEIIGVAEVPAGATSVNVPITPQTSAGTAMIVVTRNQRQPYITTIPIRSDALYTINAIANPTEGGTVSGAGEHYANSECTLTATANYGYAFDNWTLNGSVVSTEPTYTFTVSGDATYTANFHALTLRQVTYNPNQEHGTISVNPTEAYAGEVITLAATPDEGYRLDHWTVDNGNVTVTNDQFTMPDRDVTVSATFMSGYSVTVPYLIGGTVTASANTAQAGDVITLSVTPNTGYSFIEWNVYQTSNPSNTVTVTNNSFRMPTYDVTVSAVFGTQTVVENTVTVGTGTTSNSNLPTVTARRYALTEQIYTASELGAAGTITGVEFYSVRAATRNLDIYMVSTTKDKFGTTSDWIHPTVADKVFSGNVTFTANSWSAITFSTPFAYDGNNNVALIVDDNTGSTATMSFYVTSTTGYQAIFISPSNQNGTTNYDPTNITTAGNRTASKNSVKFHKTENQLQPLACEAVPTNVSASNVTPNSATISWSGEADSYNLRYRITAPKLVYDFETATPFEVDNFSPCTTYDGDATQTYGVDGIDFENEGYTGSFIAFQNGLSDSWASHGGDMFGACLAANGATNNDWFILPALSIESGDQLSFWARSLTNQYGLERIKVGVYRSSGTFSSYLAGSASTYIEVPVDWTNYSYDLSAYAGQTIQLAINCVSNDAFALFLDDISIASVSDRWDRTITNVTSPYIFTDLPEETIYEVQVQGVCDGIGGSEWVGTSFTTLSWCSTPSAMYSSNVSATSAILNWTGYQDSYNVQYRTAGGRETLLYEGFDEETLPSGWTTSGLASNSGLLEGFFAFVRNGTTPQYLISPQLDITESGCYVYFYHVGYNGTATIQIGTSSTTNSTSAFTWGTAQTIASGTSLEAYYEEIPTGTKYVGIRVNSVSSTSAYYLVDDFMILGPYIEPGAWQTVSNVTSPCTISGLSTETNYEWQVQGNCSNGTTSWSVLSDFTTHSLCDAPVGLNTTDITATSATLDWAQELNSYNVQYRTSAIAYFYDDLDGAIGEWGAYNLASGSNFYANGVDGSSCFVFMYTENPPQYLISPDLMDGVGGKTFKFVYKAFDAQYTETFQVGYFVGEDLVWEDAVETNSTDWQEYVTTVPEGATNFLIQCTSNDQYALLVDNFKIYDPNNYAEPGEWTSLFSGVTGPVTATGLAANTGYDWKVQGVDCGEGTATEWSRYSSFTTLFGLEEGMNWWAPTTAMTLAQLEEALGGKGVIINSQNGGFLRYEEGEGWSGTMTEITPGQMYKIQTTAEVSLPMSGTPATGDITILPGYNWFGYTGTTAKDIADALGSFTPEDGDQIIGQNSTVTYNNGRWTGGNFTQLVPGHGYVYFSNAQQNRTFHFEQPINNQKYHEERFNSKYPLDSRRDTVRTASRSAMELHPQRSTRELPKAARLRNRKQR
jgi:hypothetical protein